MLFIEHFPRSMITKTYKVTSRHHRYVMFTSFLFIGVTLVSEDVYITHYLRPLSIVFTGLFHEKNSE